MLNNSVLLRQVRVLNPLNCEDYITDILIREGQITAITSSLSTPKDTEIIEAQGLILAPGLVDLYSRSGEPGHEERETLKTLIDSATAGGFTRVSILPNTLPPLDTPEVVQSLYQKSQAITDNTSSRLSFWGNLTLGGKGEQMTELDDLANADIVGFTDGKPLENFALLRRLLEYLQPINKPIALFPVNTLLKGNGVIREGTESILYGLPGNPTISETTAIAAILEMIDSIRTPVHLMGVSTRRGVELIRDAKAKGIPVTASTSWMHLVFNTEDIKTYDPNLHLDPPLGNESDLLALVEGVKTGIIDAIAINHSPYTYEEKTVPFAEAPPGAIGLELALPILWEKFVKTEQWTALELIQALSINPLRCLGKQPTSIEPQKNAEVILFDQEKLWTVDRHHLKSRSYNTPWWGKEIRGQVIRIWNHQN
ncbi:dihydroorotase [Aphanothece hegewaldii CCALA 016]|uniref:Dihydroorotase n=1 Tax=Aphanothece hegewaldii CCALA 016 TaxID=2107694 RepID=A0A2T1LS86_9CHRO|nr:dihydroorotase [Aphanothece hegewaldii]PSF32473.1 dihydroorotase [Aphanothece hegewaldii CCALA 016]